jgi:putative ABC transport system permease protein
MRNLSGHAFRSFMTALGVIFGVGAVVAMMAVSEGARIEALRDIEALGIDHIIVHSIKPIAGGEASQESGSTWTAFEYGITEEDINHIENVFENITTLVPVRNLRQPVYAAGKRTDIRFFGTTPEFLNVTRCRLTDRRGRFLNDIDGETMQTACVVGVRAARTIFNHLDPIGRVLQIGGAAFRIVGLVESPAAVKIGGSYDLNNAVFTHIKTADAVFGKIARQRTSGSFESTMVEADYLYIGIRDIAKIENTSERLKTYLKKTHPRADYEVEVPYEQMKLMEAAKRRAAIVLASIAAISLLVGGIGIMNIMMANVYERIREIGTRRALGACKSDILLQFLIESIMLTFIGGIAGIILGVSMAKFVTYYFEMATSITNISIIISLAVSVFTGVAFGTYPAWKAANIDPIEALRSE